MALIMVAFWVLENVLFSENIVQQESKWTFHNVHTGAITPAKQALIKLDGRLGNSNFIQIQKKKKK